MKEKLVTNKKTYGAVLIISLLAALLLEGFLAVVSVHHGKGQPGINLWPERVASVSGYEVSYQNGTSVVEKTGSDPQMYFTETGYPYGRLAIAFAEPIEEDVQAQVYSLGAGEVYYQTVFIQKGSSRADFDLVCRDYGQMRLDLDGSFVLKTIEASPVVPWGEISLKQVLKQWNMGTFLFLWLIMVAVTYSIADFAINSGKKGAKKGSRIVSLDLLRTLAAYFAVACHVIGPMIQEAGMHTPVWKLLSAGNLLLLTCNPIFLMISGALLVKDRQESLASFYKKRLGKIVVPLAVCYLFYMAVFWTGNLTGFQWIKRAVQVMLTGSSEIAPHFWLIYIMIGIYICVPLLRKTVGRLGETGGKRLFLVIAAALSAAAWMKSKGFGGSQWLNWMLWLGIFVSGHIIIQPYMRRYDGLFGLFGFAMAAASYQIMMVRSDYSGIIFNGSIFIVGISWAVFVLALRMETILGWASEWLSFLGRHSFSVLLLHWLVLYRILMPGYLPGLLSHGVRFRIFGTFLAASCLSLAAALIFDNLIQAGFEKLAGKIRKK